MNKKLYVAYYRVSTKRQSLGLLSQRTIVKNYLGKKWPPVKSFTEKESGAKLVRPALQEALDYCYDNNATLVVAKLDRLSRSLFLLTSIEQANIDFVCCDFPHMDKLQLHILASVAQWEKEQISQRTSQALQELKRKGKKLGSHNPKVLRGLKKLWKQKRKASKEREKQIKQSHKNLATAQAPIQISKMAQDDQNIAPMISICRKEGMTYMRIAEVLNKEKIPMRRGGKWTHTQVHRIAVRNGIN